MSTTHYLEEELYAKVKDDPAIFEFLQAGSLDGIWYWDLESPGNEWLSPRFKEVFGYSVDEIPHTSAWWQENIHPDDREVALANFNRHRDDPSHPYDQVVRYRHKDGSTVWIRCRGLIIRDDDGKPVRMLGAHANVSELKKTEEALRVRNEELKRSNQELEDYGRAIAHDLRAPLRSIDGFAGLLVEECGSLSGDAKKYLDFITDGTARLKSLVNDLLAVARLEGETQEPAQVDLTSLVKRVEETLKNDIAAANATISCGDLPTVVARSTQLFQLLLNLVGNALKFSESNPVIEISAAPANGDPKRCAISVRDHGIGMEMQHAERVFELFQRLHTDDEYPGTGLGLAVCKKIVQRHGGEIRIDSEGVGKGTRVLFTLPVATDATTASGSWPTDSA